MKKLLLLALFSIGCFTISNAQFLVYSLNNSGADQWDYKMVDAGPTGPITHLNINPNQTVSGVISNFGFPLQFKCENSNGCGTSQIVPTVTNGVYVPINNCSSPTALKYRLEVVIPFIVYEFELKFG